MSKLKCPMTLMANDCVKDECAWWIELHGRDQQTQEESLKKGCVIAFSVMSNLEVAQTNRGVAAELEEMRKQTTQTQKLFQSIGEMIFNRRIEGEQSTRPQAIPAKE